MARSPSNLTSADILAEERALAQGPPGNRAPSTVTMHTVHMRLPSDAPTLAPVRVVLNGRESVFHHSSVHAAPSPLTFDELRQELLQRRSPSPTSANSHSSRRWIERTGTAQESTRPLSAVERRERRPLSGERMHSSDRRSSPSEDRQRSPSPLLYDDGTVAHSRGRAASDVVHSLSGVNGVLRGTAVGDVESENPSHALPYHPRSGTARVELDVSLTKGVGFDRVHSSAGVALDSGSLSSRLAPTWGWGYKDKDKRWVERVRNELIPEPSNPYVAGQPRSQTLVEFMAALSSDSGRKQATWRYSPVKKKHAAACVSYDQDVDEDGVENPKRARYRAALAQLQAEALERAEAGDTHTLPSFPTYEEFESDALESERRHSRFLQLYDSDSSLDEDELVASGRRSPPRAPFPSARLLYLPECELPDADCNDVNCLHVEMRMLLQAHAARRAERAERAQARARKEEEKRRRQEEFEAFMQLSEKQKESVLQQREQEKKQQEEAAAATVAASAAALALASPPTAPPAVASRGKSLLSAKSAEESKREQAAIERADHLASLLLPARNGGAAQSPSRAAAAVPSSPHVSPLSSSPLPLSELMRLHPERFLRSPRHAAARPVDAAAAAHPSPHPPVLPSSFLPTPPLRALPPPLLPSLSLATLLSDFADKHVQLVGRRLRTRAHTVAAATSSQDTGTARTNTRPASPSMHSSHSAASQLVIARARSLSPVKGGTTVRKMTTAQVALATPSALV
jgi:hypothetical protein